MTKQENLFRDWPDYIGPLGSHPLYRTWASMIQRCFNINANSFKNYGLRGITVSDEFCCSASFIGWALVNGWQLGLQLDRKDNNGPYSSANCHFVTCSENNRNRRDTVRLSDGRCAWTVAQAAGLTRSAFDNRLRRGWLPADAVTVPSSDGRKYFLSDGIPISDAARSIGLSIKTVHTRLRLGWSPDDAVSVPVGGKRPLPKSVTK